MHLTGLRDVFYAFMALGLKASDLPASRRAFEEVLQAVDGLLRERPEQLQRPAGDLLPVVERIDPSLVPELFWRVRGLPARLRQSAHYQLLFPELPDPPSRPL